MDGHELLVFKPLTSLVLHEFRIVKRVVPSLALGQIMKSVLN